MRAHRRGYSTFSSSSMGSSRSTRTRLGLHPTGGPGSGHISWGSCTGRRRRSRGEIEATSTPCQEEIISPCQKPPSASESSSTSQTVEPASTSCQIRPIFSRPDTSTFEKSRPGNRRYEGAQKRLFDLLDDDAALIFLYPHRNLFAVLEWEPIIPGDICRDGDISGFRLPDRHNPALSFSCHIHCKLHSKLYILMRCNM